MPGTRTASLGNSEPEDPVDLPRRLSRFQNNPIGAPGSTLLADPLKLKNWALAETTAKFGRAMSARKPENRKATSTKKP